MSTSGHFQGFCRDLYTESVQFFSTACPPRLAPVIEWQFTTELRLNAGNPGVETIRKDFERFGITLDLAAANPTAVTGLSHLVYWRNIVAHQKTVKHPVGVPSALTLPLVQIWLASCDSLATTLDGIMRTELTNIVGVAPW